MIVVVDKKVVKYLVETGDAPRFTSADAVMKNGRREIRADKRRQFTIGVLR